MSFNITCWQVRLQGLAPRVQSVDLSTHRRTSSRPEGRGSVLRAPLTSTHTRRSSSSFAWKGSLLSWGLGPLQGFTPSTPRSHLSAPPPPMGFNLASDSLAHRGELALRGTGGPPESQSVRTRSRSSAAPRSTLRYDDPPEVPNLISPLRSSKSKAALAHLFTSDPEPRRRALSNPLRAA